MVGGEWAMVKGLAILPSLNYYANSSSTLSVISFQFSIISYPFSDALLNLLYSPPQPAGLRNCNAAAFASLLKFAAPF